MQNAIKFFSKTFTGETTKEAYLKASNWVGKFIFSKVEIGETFWKIEKINTNFPTVKLELYAMLDPSETEKSFCNRCQEFHKSFYINQDYNCNACRMQAYNKNVKDKLNIKRGFRQERLRYLLEKND